jgi:hypothetical protein
MPRHYKSCKLLYRYKFSSFNMVKFSDCDLVGCGHHGNLCFTGTKEGRI